MDGLGAAVTRLKRLVMGVAGWRDDVAFKGDAEAWRADVRRKFDAALSDDLNTAVALTLLEEVAAKKAPSALKRDLVAEMDAVLGLGLLTLDRAALRLRPKATTVDEAEIDAILARRKEARAARDFAASDALRDELAAKGVEVMDGDPLGWEWKLG